MKPLIVGNWKMNPSTLAEARKLFNSVKKGMKGINKVETAVCVPFTYLSNFNVKGSKLKLGAQDLFWEESGAFTGEISSKMLKNLGVEYVIVGHSERRIYFKETDKIVNKKIKAVLAAKLTPILCIGETKEERKKGKVKKILKNQLNKSLNQIKSQQLKNLIVAYEPIWAIGTGVSCGVAEARKVNLFLKKEIKNTHLLYGGSVNSNNALDYVKGAGFRGLLVGGASLKYQEFIKILKNVNSLQ